MANLLGEDERDAASVARDLRGDVLAPGAEALDEEADTDEARRHGR